MLPRRVGGILDLTTSLRSLSSCKLPITSHISIGNDTSSGGEENLEFLDVTDHHELKKVAQLEVLGLNR